LFPLLAFFYKGRKIAPQQEVIMKFKSAMILLCLLLLANNVAFSMGETPKKIPQKSIKIENSRIVDESSGIIEKKKITVYITKTGKKYHRSGCRYLRRSRIPVALEDARKYYTPCSVCW